MPEKLEWYMENGDKIENISPDIFLPEEYKIEETKPELYNLEEEFVKTKKNKDILPFIFFIFFVIVLIFLSFLLIYYIQNKNKKMSIDIQDFQDLNLLDILNTVKGYEKDLLNLKDEVVELEKLRDMLIKDIKDDLTKKINALKHKKISQKDKNQKIEELRNQERERIKSVNEEYNTKIKEKKEKIDQISSKLKSFEASTLRNIKESALIEENLDPTDIEIKKVAEKYEKKLRDETDFYKSKLDRTENYYKNLIDTLILKYNPVITDAKIKELIEGDIDTNAIFNFKLNEQNFKSNSLLELRKMQEEIGILQKELGDIPYENSVPFLIKKINELEKKIVNIYEDIVYNLLIEKSNLEKENASIIKQSNSYYSAFLYLVGKDPDYGYIIDPSNINDIVFIKNENKTVNSGDKKYIIRENKQIGTIEFYSFNDNLKAKVISINEGEKILPFDKINLK